MSHCLSAMELRIYVVCSVGQCSACMVLPLNMTMKHLLYWDFIVDIICLNMMNTIWLYITLQH